MSSITFKHPTHKFHYPTNEDTTMKLTNLNERETELGYSYRKQLSLTWHYACNHHPEMVLVVGLIASIVVAIVLSNVLP